MPTFSAVLGRRFVLSRIGKCSAWQGSNHRRRPPWRARKILNDGMAWNESPRLHLHGFAVPRRLVQRRDDLHVRQSLLAGRARRFVLSDALGEEIHLRPELIDVL